MSKNRELKIATAHSKTSAHWTNTYTTIQEMTEKAYDPIVVNLTNAEYSALPKGEKDRKKDVGGFVGGHLKGGLRRKGHVLARSFITLDIDNLPADTDLPAHLTDMPFAWLAHTTMSHTPSNQRWRLWIWITRDIHPDEYGAISRRLAQDINPGLAWLDQTTYEPERLMYAPSTLSDSDYQVHISTGKPHINPDEYLQRFDNWREITTWPGITPEDIRRHHYTGEKVQDPREKAGFIGAFNRAHSIEHAITTFLPEVYKPGTVKNRWTYTGGTSANGLIIYDGGLHAYSQHATDPASEQMVNAFDLVRIHKFGHLDTETQPNTPINRMPSTVAMTDLARNDHATKLENAAETANTLKQHFTPIPPETTETAPAAQALTVLETKKGETPDDHNPDQTPATQDFDWLATLETKREGGFKDTLHNFETIFTHDPRYNHIAWNAHSERLEVQDPQALPWTQLKPGWTDNDTAQLKTTLANNYQGLYSPTKMHDALTSTAAQRAFHPVRDYFHTLPQWDGIPRIDYLLIDYLGAANTDYTKAVTRKTLIAAVRRTHNPGTKFDTVLVLAGPQGAGKSTIFEKLAGQWFSDSLTIGDMKDKDGAEKLAGVLIMEIAELAGMRKTDAETLKGFISRTDDKYRPAYGRVVESHPRQGIIVGTTNAKEGFLRDPTGGRRFWPVDVTGNGAQKTWNLKPETIDQIWAEAVHYNKENEPLHLEGALADAATQRQTESVETDDRVGIVQDYLDQILPAAWDHMDLSARRYYLDSGTLPAGENYGPNPWGDAKQRTSVSKIEIWTECFGRKPEDMKRTDSYEISGIMAQLPEWEDTGKRVPLHIYGRQRVFEKKEALIRKSDTT
ncbi:virulance-associated protein E / DNA primase [Corynebacterium phage CL31]|nr:virulance-associated protein E / DNA primase [Corynebacterium phage CL31]